MWPAAEALERKLIEKGEPLQAQAKQGMRKGLHSCSLEGHFLPQAAMLCLEGDGAEPCPDTQQLLEQISKAASLDKHVSVLIALCPDYAPRLQVAERLQESQSKAAAAMQYFFEWKACVAKQADVKTRKTLLVKLLSAIIKLGDVLKSATVAVESLEESPAEESCLKDFELWPLLGDLVAKGNAAKAKVCDALLASLEAVVAGGELCRCRIFLM